VRKHPRKENNSLRQYDEHDGGGKFHQVVIDRAVKRCRYINVRATMSLDFSSVDSAASLAG
jgi:hypothetical protein